jgi:hypothetical protein
VLQVIQFAQRAGPYFAMLVNATGGCVKPVTARCGSAKEMATDRGAPWPLPEATEQLAPGLCFIPIRRSASSVPRRPGKRSVADLAQLSLSRPRPLAGSCRRYRRHSHVVRFRCEENGVVGAISSIAE